MGQVLYAGEGQIPARQAAVKAYDNWVASFAQESLDNYLAAIVFHVLPLMHDLDNLTRIEAYTLEPQYARVDALDVQHVVDKPHKPGTVLFGYPDQLSRLVRLRSCNIGSNQLQRP